MVAYLSGNIISLETFCLPGDARMTARGRQGEQPDNVVQFPRDMKVAPSCSQCHIPMVVMRCEPEPNEPAVIAVMYRCPQCGLRERRMMR
jgi:hypothetical protein